VETMASMNGPSNSSYLHEIESKCDNIDVGVVFVNLRFDTKRETRPDPEIESCWPIGET
jgi:hypothetical protein